VQRVTTGSGTRPLRELEDVDGWFARTDQLVMDFLLGHQERTGVSGDLLEMGAYLGKSTILIGFHRRAGERFVVCDLFGTEPPTEENRRTAALYTANLTRDAFEANYAAFHDELPEVIQEPTTQLGDHVPQGSCRFVHVDACHVFDVVREDIRTARRVLDDGGIVVFDDIRAAHTPGVAVAVWPEVASGDLRPICITPNKLYATWGEATSAQDSLLAWLRSQDGARYESHRVAGRPLIQIANWAPAPPSPVPPARDAPPLPRRRVPPVLRRVAADLLPPALTRAVRRAR
jgi:hypothetical protein